MIMIKEKSNLGALENDKAENVNSKFVMMTIKKKVLYSILMII
jgi:hypothetical protein